ncbi:hydroxysqualene dehydroxylase HpnE [Comamonas sp. NLF-1-9]|uniref:hydroxysqualene dehydroxylase HpnE n=1 Tax=Comamonas sp. NLF-1-9 TaxID=2853163 RepID=UPI001C47FCCE|nr:hydroxysqualene dehydroxylase HpnE [Comamonas sp. NLF-1-9]QXL85266.1 hydroxysqualene dehydroxylase HpnE [Comamonas sp. NLF-1-9]
MKVAVVGAGWAGCAAALEAAQQGHRVTLLEAGREAGGRARTVTVAGPEGSPLALDNGQHILIGAYRECLRLMRLVGVQPESALQREPLALRFADGSGLALPDIAPPWDALAGIARARGWSLAERLALLRQALAWRLGGFACASTATVAELCARLPARLVQEFIAPLCISALNTPPDCASGQVFLTVLRDSLFAGRGGSNLLLPRLPLGALLPEPALHWLRERGHAVHLGRRVQTLAHDGRHWHVDGEAFDAVLLACPSSEATRLLAHAGATGAMRLLLQAWVTAAEPLAYGAIATVYARLPGARGPVLGQAMLALRPGADAPAQFVFDRGRLGGPPGLLAFVVSAFSGERRTLAAQVLRQAQSALGLAGLQVLQTVVERRATFSCTPALNRPAMHIAPGLLACADYVDGPYPATLEGAVRLGVAAARSLAGAAAGGAQA